MLTCLVLTKSRRAAITLVRAVRVKNIRSVMGSNDTFLGEVETIIIGGGQAGLSVGRYLKEYGHSYLILEKSDSIASSWKGRYDSLVLDSFAKYSHLEGFPFQGD